MARGKAVQADRNPFDIHEDKVTTTKQGWDVRRISNSYPDQNSDSGADDVSDGSGSSESSDDSSEAVDPAVLEDIAKFEATFQGINQRFKVLNRIGEGTFCSRRKRQQAIDELYQALSPWFTRQKIYYMSTTTMTGTSTHRIPNIGYHRLSKNIEPASRRMAVT